MSGGRAMDRMHAVERSGGEPADATWTGSAIFAIAATGCTRQEKMQLDLSTPPQHLPSGQMLVAVTQSGLMLAADSVGGNPPISSTATTEATNLRRVIGHAGAHVMRHGQSRVRLAKSA